MGVTVRGSAASAIVAIKRRVAPTMEDALYLGERQRARILDRTSRGVDVDGRAFVDYSTKKFYFSPDGRLNGSTRELVSDKKRKTAVKRLFRVISRGERKGKTGAPYVSRSGLSICFPGGYKQFKKWLGRSGVDLRGKNAPHMLQAIQIRATPGEGAAAKEVKLGIYGPKAKIANAHNEGGRVPRRRFFGISRSDRKAAVSDLQTRMIERLKNARV